MREARTEIDAVVADLKKQAAALAEQAAKNAAASPSTGDTGRLRGDARAAIDALVDKYRKDEAPAAPVETAPSRAVAVGDRVMLGPLGLEGVVVNVHDREAEVEVRGKRFRAHTIELRVLGGAPPKPEPPAVRVNVQLQPRDGVSSSELMLVGNTVDQALDRLEKFLDESLLGELADHPVDPRLRHRPPEGSRRRVSAQASARDAGSPGDTAGRRRRGDYCRIERLMDWKIGRLFSDFRF